MSKQFCVNTIVAVNCEESEINVNIVNGAFKIRYKLTTNLQVFSESLFHISVVLTGRNI